GGGGGGRGFRRLRWVGPLEGRPLLRDAAGGARAGGDRALGDAARGSGTEEGAGRGAPALRRRRPPRSGRAPHALAALRLGRARRAFVPRERAAVGRSGPLRASPAGRRAGGLAPPPPPRAPRGPPVH